MKEVFKISVARILDDLTVDELSNVLKSYHAKSVADAGHNIKIEEHYSKEGNFTGRYCVTLYDVVRRDEAYDTIPEALLTSIYEGLKDIRVETKDKIYIISLLECLSVRTINALRRAGYNALNDLENLTRKDVSKIRNLGYVSLHELEQVMEAYGFKFKEEK